MTYQQLLDRLTGKAPKGAKRSGTWRATRAIHLEDNPNCAVCRGKHKVQVHHIIPFYLAPDIEENEDNLVSLCQAKRYGINCHLLIGHLGNFKRINPACRSDIATWRQKLG